MKIKKLLNILETDELISLISLILFLIIISFLEIIGISLVPILFSAVIGGEFFIYKIDINFINKFIQSNTQSDLVLYISIFIIFFYFIKNLIFAYSIYFQGKIIKNIKISFSKKLLEFYISQNYLYLLEKNSPVLVRTLTSDLGNSAICILHIVNLLRDFLILFGITTFLFLANPVVSLFLFILFSIAVFFFYNFNKKNFFYRSKIIQSLSSDIIKIILEIVGLFKDIKIYNIEKFQEIAYEKKVILNENQILKNYFITSIPKLFLEFIGVASIVLIVIFFIVINKDLVTVLPYLSLIVISSLRLMPIFNGISNSLNYLKLTKPSFDLVIQELKEHKKNSITIDEKVNINFKSSIKLEKVSFNYPGQDKPVIHDLSLQIQKNEKLGIIGQSGAGKSTLINLILGLIKPTYGDIIIDDKNFISKKNIILNNVGYVPQEIYLLDDTIRKNIAIGIKEEEIDDDKLKISTKLAQLYDFIDMLPNKFNTLVGERGKNISVGQKQRIGVARALYRNPELLILDESTSSLDSITEKKFINDIFEMNKDKTIIFISHRHAALNKCEKIFDLDKLKFVDNI